MLPDIIYAYRRQYPDVQLQLRELFTGDQFLALSRGDLDVGLVRFGGSGAPPVCEPARSGAIHCGW